jgi:hypothetical protein
MSLRLVALLFSRAGLLQIEDLVPLLSPFAPDEMIDRNQLLPIRSSNWPAFFA